MKAIYRKLVSIQVGSITIEGALEIPENPVGIVLFAHGSGSSRLSPRNNFVARALHDAHIATLLLDLLTPQEDERYDTRFDIHLLTRRLEFAFNWLNRQELTKYLRPALFGASTGAAAALRLAATQGSELAAVVSRGGRPDLAGNHLLAKVTAPTLLIVGGADTAVIDLNKAAYDALQCEKHLEIVEGATHLFEEPGALDQVALLASNWFQQHFTSQYAGTQTIVSHAD